jgi:hypothetical protein
MDPDIITEAFASGRRRDAYIERRNGEHIAETMRSEVIECAGSDQLIKQALGPLT